jgi:O-antigen ligase
MAAGTAPPLGRRVAAAAVGVAAWIITAGLVLSAFFIPGVPAWTIAATAAYVVLSFLRPGAALVVLVALGPLINIAGQLWDAPAPWLEVIVLAFFAGWLPRRVARTGCHPDPINPPAAAFAAIVGASILVAAAALLPGFPDAGSALASILPREYLAQPGAFPAFQQGALLLEGLGLFIATSQLLKATPGDRARILRMIVVGASGMAVLTILRVLIGAVRTGDFQANAVEYFLSIRFNAAYGDVNAAGSHIVLALLICAGLAMEDRARRAAWIVAAAVLTIALWLTGSRIAILAAAGALGTAGIMLAGGAAAVGRSRRQLHMWAAVLAAVAVFGLLLASGRMLRSDTPRSIQIRAELAATAGRMLRTAPIFGIGIGQFYESSARFSSPALLAIYSRENAHNNFLQIAAELGLAGAAAFAWLLWTVGRRFPARASVRGRHYLMTGVASGAAAFLLTAAAGHPLLTPAVAYTFWIVLGWAAFAGPAHDGGAAAPARASRRTGFAVSALIIVVVCASLPWRVQTALDRANLEHVEFGFGKWVQDEQGRRYHPFSREAVLFLPAGTRAWLPMRMEEGRSDTAIVQIRVDGRQANAVVVGGAWQRVPVVAPAGSSNAAFRRVELSVSSPDRPDGSDAIVWVGRPEFSQ